MVESKTSLSNLTKNFNNITVQELRQKEEDYWISEEELHTEGSSDEEKVNSSKKSRSKSKGKPQSHFQNSQVPSAVFNPRTTKGSEMDSGLSWNQNDIEDMLKQVKKIQEKLSEDNELDIMKSFEKEAKYTKQVNSNDQRDLKIHFEEIEKMDAFLKMKLAEEKGARLSRIQAEEEFKDSLNKLTVFGASNAIKNNFQAFLNLLSEVTHEEESSKSEEKVEEPKELVCEQSLKNGIFVARNIQLAKCGRGILSLTDEEKVRVQDLLRDDDDTEKAEIPKFSSQPGNALYGWDEDTRSTLSQIDKKLEVLTKTKPLKKEKLDDNEQKKYKKKNSNRLKEINKLLDCINSISEEEIEPLSTEHIQSLIEEGKEDLNSEALGFAEQDFPSDSSMPKTESFQNVITELVSDAQILMPKFKYRYDYS